MTTESLIPPIVTGNNYAGDCILLRSNGMPVRVGDIVESFRGTKYKVTGGRAPLNGHSTGRVWVTDPEGSPENDHEYFPTVFDLHWQPVQKSAKTK